MGWVMKASKKGGLRLVTALACAALLAGCSSASADDEKSEAPAATATPSAERSSAGFVGDEGSQVYVKDLFYGVSGNWNAAMNDLRNALEATGDPYVILGDGDGYWDLNRGAGGAVIYLGYTTTTNRAEAVTDIQFNMSTNNHVDGKLYPQGLKGPVYQYLGVDLNHPVTKQRNFSVALYYSNSDGGTPANARPYVALGLDMCWNSNRSCSSFVPAGSSESLPWARFDLDLNKKGGGDWIWLKAQRIDA